ncbi:hypothetical protein IQ07DRAFT_413734 [Pyrenochaeta sp. DS3sAY3a]|nr:hypothetical protein IQ07DRAFT_413734 [Pyrenochaeta sp. DS3sAY3a]
MQAGAAERIEALPHGRKLGMHAPLLSPLVSSRPSFPILAALVRTAGLFQQAHPPTLLAACAMWLPRSAALTRLCFGGKSKHIFWSRKLVLFSLIPNCLGATRPMPTNEGKCQEVCFPVSFGKTLKIKNLLPTENVLWCYRRSWKTSAIAHCISPTACLPFYPVVGSLLVVTTRLDPAYAGLCCT